MDLTRDSSDRIAVKTSFPAFPVSHEGRNWHTAGELREPLPEGDARRPAVLIVHGSAGVDSRAEAYAAALNRAGLITFEIDLWAARAIASAQERPRSPFETLPDAYAARDCLAARSSVDASRIAIMGFSWGGVMSMLTATRAVHAQYGSSGQPFAAHAPLYPVCWLYNRMPGFDFRELSGAPVFIQTGTDDHYDDPDACARLVETLPEKARAHVHYRTYDGATHAWDRREPDMTPTDPMARKGQGGEVPFRYNEDVTHRSVTATVEFFAQVLRAG
jgi:dienelactone hydrolase